MAQQVLVPKLGLTMETGLIEEWLVAPGSRVAVGDPLLRMGTDKVDVEVEAEGDGVFHPVVAEGADLPPGTLIGWLLADGEDLPDATGSPAVVAADAGPTEPPPAAPGPVADEPAGESPGRLLVSPNARRVAAERGIDLTTLRGTGPRGRIITADVLEAPVGVVASAVPVPDAPGAPGGTTPSDVPAATAAPVAPAAPSEPGEPLAVIALSGVRGVIAARMHASLQEMAQLTLGAEVSMDAAVALREQLAEQWTSVPSWTDLVVRAAALALREHPRLNASVEDGAIVVHSEVNVGLAVALEEGLVVPVVRHADRLPLSAITAETTRLAGASRSRHRTLADLEGGTFTVSTLGGHGIDFFTPVITPGQVAILGVGRLRDSVRWDGEVPRRTQVLTLSLTIDHRAVDGAPAADFLRTVADRLAAPLSLLA